MQTDLWIGDYLAKARLGQGGMGVVYRATPLSGGRDVAIKTLHAASEVAFASMRREIRALSRIRHPGVVRVLDQGVHQGLPWYAMELIEGRTLLDHVIESGSIGPQSSRSLSPIGAAWSAETITGETMTRDGIEATEVADPELLQSIADLGPPSAARVRPGSGFEVGGGGEATLGSPAAQRVQQLQANLPILIQLCSALAFLHGEGIVHRDLKPDNIIIDSDERPVLVDFGISSQFSGSGGRDSLGDSSLVMGTAAYIAPEQIRNQLVDARADLYSLGCILYELLTGRPPFLSSSVGQLLHAQLYETPLPPKQLVPSIPEALNELVLRLLAKQPTGRLGYALDVGRALRDLLDEAGPASVGPAPNAYLYQPELAGRERELAGLSAAADAALAGDGAICWISGESGIGKTRLLLQMMRDTKRRTARVVGCGAQPPRGDGGQGSFSLLGPLLAALADYSHGLSPEESQLLLGSARRVLGIYEPRLFDGKQPADRLSPDQLRQEALSQLTRVLRQWALVQPIVLVLDDLQWADQLSLDWLAFAANPGSLADSPILVVASFRSDEAGPALRQQAQAAGDKHCQLFGLDGQSITSMAADMLALAAPPFELSSFLVQRAGGSPFFVSEYLRAAVGQGILARGLDGRWQLTAAAESLRSVPLPSTLVELVKLRFKHLSQRAQRVTELAAVFGRRVQTDTLYAAYQRGNQLGLFPALSAAAFDDAIKQLMVHNVFELATQDTRRQNPDASEQLVFAHDKLHEVAYARLDPDVKRSLHAIAAESLAERSDPRAGAYRRIAQHFASAGQHNSSVRYYVLAGLESEARGALPDALLDLAAAHQLAASPEVDPTLRLQACLSLGEIETATGRIDAALSNLDRARSLAARLGDERSQVRAHVSLSYVSYLGGQGPATMQHAERAAKFAHALGDPALEARVENALGIAWGSTGYYRKAIEHYSKAAHLCEETGDQSSAGKHHGNISINQRLLGELAQAHHSAELAVTHAHAAGVTRLEANARCNLGRVEMEQGDTVSARLNFMVAIELSRRVEMTFVEAEASWGLGVADLSAGELESAERNASQASELSARGYAVTQGLAERLLGQISRARGDSLRAEQHLRASVEVLRTAGERDELADSLVQLASVSTAEALRLRAEARAIYQELGMAGRLRELPDDEA